MLTRVFVSSILATSVLASTFVSAGFQAPQPAPLPAPPDVAAAPPDAIVTASGLASKVLTPGYGTDRPTTASTVKVHYSGWTTDGQMFDSSVVRGAPSSFGVTRVIRGWTEGVQLMVQGEKRRFWIPAALAYGDSPRPGAPRGLLVFDVELLGISTPVDASAHLAAYGTHTKMAATSPYRRLPWQSIGPSNHTGRMTAIAVSDTTARRNIYVGAASGGVWKSTNLGRTWRSIFEFEASTSIGDVAVSQSRPTIVWVGTGESNLFRAGMPGTGVYKSIDAGRTWHHTGLADSGTIGRIVLHPTNPNIAYVAASGNEWTPNESRGVFKTIDGGKTWTKSLYRSPDTGAVDLVMDPSNPNTLYAAVWQRVRRKWSDPRVEPGYSNSGIWKTADAGATWSPADAGLPIPSVRGRIGLDVSRSNPNVVYAVVDNYAAGRQAEPGEKDAYGRPLPDGSAIIRGMEVYRSDDRGATWRKTSGQTPETAAQMMGLGNTYNWVFTQIRVDTQNENRVYVLALGVSVSDDAGATFTPFEGGGGDNHRMWIDPADSNVIYTASDMGLAMTTDRGKTKRDVTGISGTQFYNVTLDMATPFHAYGSVQDAGSFRAPVAPAGRDGVFAPRVWESAPGGEGSNHVIDPANPDIVYSHGFYGNFTRTDLTSTPASVDIQPKAVDAAALLRAQWMAPIVMSPFDANTLYAGYQYVYRSRDRGDTWERISPDLTDNNPRRVGVNPSAIPYQTITHIAESPLTSGVLYAGTDDGRLHVSQDEGKTWTDIGKNLPIALNKWVSRIVPSQYDAGTVFVAQRGREDDDFGVYLWKSTDHGATWNSIAGNIPSGSINVIREDPSMKDVLYVGNDFGVYVSKDGGAQWHVLGAQLPSVQVSDLQIHPRDHIIVIATYGRGMWVMDANRVRAVVIPRPRTP